MTGLLMTGSSRPPERRHNPQKKYASAKRASPTPARTTTSMPWKSMEDPKPRGRSGLIARAVDTALLPVHAAASKPAQRAYLGTFLFAATSILLFCVSSVAYTLFYYNYVPQNSVERVVHLQFGCVCLRGVSWAEVLVDTDANTDTVECRDGHPHGTAHLSTSLTSLQPYDITLSLHLPRTPSNLAAGNFMLDLSLLGPSTTGTPSSILPSSLSSTTNTTTTIARSRRPAILTYTSAVVETANTLSGLPWYILGWKSESEVLSVSMFEGVEFAKGWANVPQSVRVVVEADEKMQFYEVGVRIIAKLGGLRWVLYHHRVLSFLFFTTAFWSSSMISMALAWFAISTYLGSPTTVKTEPETNGTIFKRERSDSDAFDPTSMEDLSDTSRTFPTLGRQIPLHFTGRKDVKKEEEIKREEDEVLRSTAVQPLAAEADDEDDDMSQETSGFRDSGIGTGLDDERLASVQRRRRALMNGKDSGA
ncbi:hypothetical protein HO173_002927 [Letharia columbiana]|uniref:Seipin n=1 Tax=Letharia columbiana TaxID=112416 RepID=A0A8H6L7X1_9LECA|nr:uncharacterized protein HO173_002927 [Letharia columbiana]KAF6239055.1 hypothetical protein HO173_002927 [Letharia columbiana]